MKKPFKQTYEETQKVEEETSVRDYFYITTIVNNNFTIQEITNEEMQYEGADMLLAKREAPLDGKVYLLLLIFEDILTLFQLIGKEDNF